MTYCVMEKTRFNSSELKSGTFRKGTLQSPRKDSVATLLPQPVNVIRDIVGEWEGVISWRNHELDF